MKERGGGIESMDIRKSSESLPGAFQIFVKFRTADAMGANFINTVLEALSQSFKNMIDSGLPGGRMEIIMSILSNFTPECLVACHVESHPEAFDQMSQGMTGREFAEKFTRAVEIARYDPYRAVTHNKGIFNGMDAVIMATGNDYRAVEACGHAYASSQGEYTSLTRAKCTETSFSLTLEVPLALGTIGGLTSIHPMAATAIEILGHPDAEKLMSVVAAAGLASNFSAIRSLITTGIQQGHMKMHLGNILRQLNATAKEVSEVKKAFSGKTVTFAGVKEFLESVRNQNSEI
jgi:hydroxymethylglutaryl-CoA reductase